MFIIKKIVDYGVLKILYKLRSYFTWRGLHVSGKCKPVGWVTRKMTHNTNRILMDSKLYVKDNK